MNQLKNKKISGHSGTQNVFWNITGKGQINSAQYGWGYIIGTGKNVKLTISDGILIKGNTLPLDYVEGAGKASFLQPQSLYLRQRQKRLQSRTRSVY